MKYLLVLLALAIPSVLAAQPQPGGRIGIYADQTTGICLVRDTPGPKTLYVFHTFSFGHTGSRFRIVTSPGFTGTILSTTAVLGSVTGDPTNGLTLNYGTCIAGSVEILQLQVMTYGTGPECSWVRTEPYAGSVDGLIDAYDCLAQRVPADWGGTHIQLNTNLWCPDISDGDGGDVLIACKPVLEPLAVEGSTWGAVKSLYR